MVRDQARMSSTKIAVRPWRTTWAFRALAAATAVALVAADTPVRAQAPNAALPIIRDAETEQLLRDYTSPILRAAGLTQQNVHVVREGMREAIQRDGGAADYAAQA